MNLSYRPLPPVWPSGQRTPIHARQRSRFKASYQNTLNLLERELRHLGVSDYDAIVVEAGYQPSEIRIDGLPRANARPSDPAVILSFQSRYGPLRYGCDTYWAHDDNIRAIALALEALRAVDRYGVTKRGEQYVGWKQLAAAGESLSAREAREWLVSESGNDFAHEMKPSELYRTVAKRVHPDSPTGSREKWDRLQRVKTVLGL